MMSGGDAVAYARRLGPRWAAQRARYEIERRTGVLGRRSPERPWSAFDDGATPARPDVVDVGTLRRWLAANTTSDRRTELAAIVADTATGWRQVFGHRVRPDSWHHDAVSGAHYPADRHWTRTPELAHADVKLVWEPSRFRWAFDLARAHLLQVGDDPGVLFWRTFEDWCTQNPPHTGINWACGQEAAIRLMAVACAADVTWDVATPADRKRFRQFIAVTGERILANWRYARSQDNNHIVSEAAGLVTVAALAADLPIAARCRALGFRELERACERLVFPDGGTSQYSLNYHRVFVHDLCWVVLVCRSGGIAPPVAVTRALARATDFLDAMCIGDDGSGPWFGHDDGAEVLPVAEARHRDLRPALQLAAVVARHRRALPAGEWDEACAWFESTAPRLDSGPIRRVNPAAEHFEDAGCVVLRTAGHVAVVQCRRHRFRPAHADQLHTDVWLDGAPVTIDVGTYSYKAPPPWDQPLKHTAFHNTVTVDDTSQMPLLGRFLWSRWSTGTVRHCGVDGGGVGFRGAHDGYLPAPLRCRHEREVFVGRDGVVVQDVVVSQSGSHRITLNWNGSADHIAIESLPIGDVSSECGSGNSPRGWTALDYEQLEPMPSMRSTVAAAVVRFTTTIRRSDAQADRSPQPPPDR